MKISNSFAPNRGKDKEGEKRGEKRAEDNFQKQLAKLKKK